MPEGLQAKFLELIFERYQRKADAVEDMAQVLSLGKDAVYRRVRLETSITPDEMATLAKHYKLSLDELIYKNTETFFFTFNALTRTVHGFEDFLGSVYADIHMLSHIPDALIYYASGEIPIFYYCFYPELISFKLYIWGKTIWDIPYIRSQPYSIDLIPFPSYQLSQDIVNLYRRLPTIELWSLNFMDNTLNQIEYQVNTGGFVDNQEAVVLCDKLIELALHMKSMAEHGRKFAPNRDPSTGGSFNLFHNEMIYTNNTILVATPVGKMVYTTFCNPNFLKTSDPDICDFKEKWFKQILERSNKLSQGSGEKMREWFFSRILRKIEVMRNRVQGHLDDHDDSL